MRTVDDAEMPPPQIGVDHDTITSDVESAIRAVLCSWIERVAVEEKVGKRQAAARVLAKLRFCASSR